MRVSQNNSLRVILKMTKKIKEKTRKRKEKREEKKRGKEKRREKEKAKERKEKRKDGHLFLICSGGVAAVYPTIHTVLIGHKYFRVSTYK